MRQGADKDFQLIPIVFTSTAATIDIPSGTLTKQGWAFVRGISIIPGLNADDALIEETSLSVDFKLNDDYILPVSLPARVLLTKADTDPNCRAFDINRCVDPGGARVSGQLTTTATIVTTATVYIALWLERNVPETADCSPCNA